jgi:hypothetical protein
LSAENKHDILAFIASLLQLSDQGAKSYHDTTKVTNQVLDKVLEKETALQLFFKLPDQKDREPVWKTISSITDVLTSIKWLKNFSEIHTELDPEEMIRSTRKLRKELQWLAQDLVPSKSPGAPLAA